LGAGAGRISTSTSNRQQLPAHFALRHARNPSSGEAQLDAAILDSQSSSALGVGVPSGQMQLR